MATLAEKFTLLKTGVGGNREKMHYEDTFGMPREEAYYITPPNPWHRRMLGELEFALRLAKVNGGRYDSCLEGALDLLLAARQAQGVITNSDIASAEAMLQPMAQEAKTYSLILAGHAHIDMNWMWSWQETVASTLDTFRTMLNIMEEYPDFCFSQSQAAVYKIVEDFDPGMMGEIKRRIAEGRWEVTASAWVETDKNMPNTESMARHILYSKNYLEQKWGVDPAELDIDFSPDTFGHSAHLPELVSHGGVKYYYHCRGYDGPETLYRWRAPSGREVLAYREPYWYNSAITPHIGIGLVDLAQRCGGLKTGLVVYGVGNHGGGPTRRDVERALDMMQWPIFPSVRFGTMRSFFQEAESVRDRLNVVERELNFIFPGCYTTQSRIKLGNRKSEAALGDAEALGALAAQACRAPYFASQFERAWQNVLFTHFHDILTGSCVQDSREHAMGLYSEALAVANTNRARAMRAVAAAIDTSALFTEGEIANSQSEGAGAGYGIGSFAVPSTERSAGLSRIYHLFNPSAHERRAVTELTVWDWVGDMRRIEVVDAGGSPVPYQLVDTTLQQYWDHKYFRILVDAIAPPLGYATYVLRQADIEEYPFYYQPDRRTHHPFDNYVLDNGLVRAEFDRRSAELISLFDLAEGLEYIKPGETAGLRLAMTEGKSSNAWLIGRILSEEKLTCNTNVKFHRGALRQSLEVELPFLSSQAKLTISLDKGARAVCYAMTVDWHEISKDDAAVAMLKFFAPAGFDVERYLYDVPAGSLERDALHIDVPALQYGAAAGGGRALAVFADSKHGYRGDDGGIGLTLIHAANKPDPYPERGIHQIRLALAAEPACAKALEEAAYDFNHPFAYVSARAHAGSLPLCGPLLELGSDTAAALSAIKQSEDGSGLVVRLYNTAHAATTATLQFPWVVGQALPVDIMEQPAQGSVAVEQNEVTVELGASAMAAVKIVFRQA